MSTHDQLIKMILLTVTLRLVCKIFSIYHQVVFSIVHHTKIPLRLIVQTLSIPHNYKQKMIQFLFANHSQLIAGCSHLTRKPKALLLFRPNLQVIRNLITHICLLNIVVHRIYVFCPQSSEITDRPLLLYGPNNIIPSTNAKANQRPHDTTLLFFCVAVNERHATRKSENDVIKVSRRDIVHIHGLRVHF